MSFIPDCRPKYAKDVDHLYPSKEPIDEKEINGYWYGLLQGKDAEFIRGFDYNTVHAVNNLFDNLDVYATELAEAGIDVESIDLNVVDGAPMFQNETFVEQDEREYKSFEEYTEEEKKQMTNATKLLLIFKDMLNDYIEMQRDELVTSMIDSMDDEVHTKRVVELQQEES